VLNHPKTGGIGKNDSIDDWMACTKPIEINLLLLKP
jgi:hypothetical protein